MEIDMEMEIPGSEIFSTSAGCAEEPGQLFFFFFISGPLLHSKLWDTKRFPGLKSQKSIWIHRFSPKFFLFLIFFELWPRGDWHSVHNVGSNLLINFKWCISFFLKLCYTYLPITYVFIFPLYVCKHIRKGKKPWMSVCHDLHLLYRFTTCIYNQ